MLPGFLLAALWLILYHLLPLVGFHFQYEAEFYAALQLAAGIGLVLHIRGTRNRHWGFALAGVFFIIVSLIILARLNFQNMTAITMVIAAAAGVLMLVGRKVLPTASVLFGLFLLFIAAQHFLGFNFEGIQFVKAVLAIGAGVMILIRR